MSRENKHFRSIDVCKKCAAEAMEDDSGRGRKDRAQVAAEQANLKRIEDSDRKKTEAAWELLTVSRKACGG